MKRLKERINEFMQNTTLEWKVRNSYLILFIPVVFLVLVAFLSLWIVNRRFDSMLDSCMVASDFSLDFKSDFDYETYLLIVGNKSLEESSLNSLLGEATRVVERLRTLTDSGENLRRLESVSRYLQNLGTYKSRIEENLKTDGNYEDNIEIWENDVQIVTSLIQTSIYEYTYYETRELQASREQYRKVFFTLLLAFLIALGVIIALIVSLSITVSRSITRPILEISRVTEQVAGGDLSVRSNVRSGVETTALSTSLNAMIDKIEELLGQVRTEQMSLRKAEFELLQAQINPHFLYNTLDAIVWLAEAGDQKTVVRMVGSLSEFFRTSLNEGRDIVTVKEEMMHVRSYLEIQQVRYSDILKYEIDVPESLNPWQIPKITLQPLVENAIYHGVKNRRGGGCVRIAGEETETEFVITVSDDGEGMTPERLEEVRQRLRGGEAEGVYGLYNVAERIRLNFGEEYGLRIDSRLHEGTQIRVRLPKRAVTVG